MGRVESGLLQASGNLKRKEKVVSEVLTVLDALRGKSVVLLTASPANAVRHGMAPPYGVKLILSR